MINPARGLLRSRGRRDRGPARSAALHAPLLALLHLWPDARIAAGARISPLLACHSGAAAAAAARRCPPTPLCRRLPSSHGGAIVGQQHSRPRRSPPSGAATGHGAERDAPGGGTDCGAHPLLPRSHRPLPGRRRLAGASGRARCRRLLVPLLLLLLAVRAACLVACRSSACFGRAPQQRSLPPNRPNRPNRRVPHRRWPGCCRCRARRARCWTCASPTAA